MAFQVYKKSLKSDNSTLPHKIIIYKLFLLTCDKTHAQNIKKIAQVGYKRNESSFDTSHDF